MEKDGRATIDQYHRTRDLEGGKGQVVNRQHTHRCRDRHLDQRKHVAERDQMPTTTKAAQEEEDESLGGKDPGQGTG